MENGKQPILDNQFLENKGLTKREYFAGLAMQGVLSTMSRDSGFVVNPISLSVKSIEIADELLKQLDK